MSNKGYPQIDITFAPTWWHHNYGMDFGSPEDWHDPLKAVERDRLQRRLLYERFSDVGLGEVDPKPVPQVGGEFGHRLMSAFWGCEVVYFQDQWPHAVAHPDAEARMDGLQVPSPENHPVIELLLHNARLLEQAYGHCKAVVNFGGPLNNAISVFGESMFMACAATPNQAQMVLYKMAQAVLLVHEQVECRMNGLTQTQAWSTGFSLGNCPVGQISPGTYRRVVRPVDLWLRSQFEGSFSLHHCGLFHPYNEVYQVLQAHELDIGPGSDLRATRGAYPSARLSTYIDVGRLAAMNQKAVDTLLNSMVEDAGSPELFTAIRVAEIGPEISDETIRNLLTAFDQNL